MNETAFFQTADNLQVPTGNGLHPFFKETRAVAVTQCAGSHNPCPFHRVALHRAMKAAQDFQRLGHGLRIEIAVTKYTFAQARDLAILMQGDQMSASKLSDTQPHRVRTDINRGKNGHVLSGVAGGKAQRLRRMRRLFSRRLRERK